MRRLTSLVALPLTLACLMTGCAKDANPVAEPEEVATFDVTGALALYDFRATEREYQTCLGKGGDGCSAPEGSPCEASDGYEDIAPGAQVRILDNKGAVVGLGELEDGTLLRDADIWGGGPCIFNFNVADVADSGNIYAVEVADRGESNFTKDDASSVVVTLGR